MEVIGRATHWILLKYAKNAIFKSGQLKNGFIGCIFNHKQRDKSFTNSFWKVGSMLEKENEIFIRKREYNGGINQIIIKLELRVGYRRY